MAEVVKGYILSRLFITAKGMAQKKGVWVG